MMENDAISRSMAIEALDQHSYETGRDYDKTVELLSDLPALDVAPVVHARSNDAKKYVSSNLTYRAMLEGLAEECCELAQAALKRIRAMNGENPTPVSEKECDEKLHEEAGDVLMLLELLSIIEDGTTAHNHKWERWAKRIRESKHSPNCGARMDGGVE